MICSILHLKALGHRNCRIAGSASTANIIWAPNLQIRILNDSAMNHVQYFLLLLFIPVSGLRIDSFTTSNYAVLPSDEERIEVVFWPRQSVLLPAYSNYNLKAKRPVHQSCSRLGSIVLPSLCCMT